MDKVVHFEIPAEDMARAEKFYKENFDWNITKVPMAGGEYFLVNTVDTDEKGMPKSPGAINGGLMKREGTAQTPVIVIKVASLDQALGKIKKSGGKVVMDKMNVGDMGLYARITDTEGNIIGVWQDLPQK